MPEPEDHQLLIAFARTESEPAFTALAERYVNLVYSTALRSTSNPHHAEEITQAVFIILARKAGKLSPRVVLSGWLYQTARLTSANFMKGESRRQRREQEAYMQSALNEPAETIWKEITPLLDDAMGRLGQTDRNAVVLRFFENKSAAEIGAALRMNEETARRRVNRALEKLRKYFAKRGVASSTAAIAENISARSIQTAPVALVKSATAMAMAKGSIAAASTMTLAKGTMKMMTWTTYKTVIAMGVLFAVGTTAVVLNAGSNVVKHTNMEIGGIITAKTYRNDRVVRTDSNSFMATIDGDNIRINAGPMGNSSISDFEYGTLGKDSYLLIRHTTNFLVKEAFVVENGVAKRVKLTTPVKPENDAEIYLNDGPIPEYTFGLISPVWMAYGFHLSAKHAKINHVQTPPILSMGAPRREHDGLADVSFRLNSDPPYMLQALIESGAPKQFKSLKGLSQAAFTNAIFETLEWTNVGGLTVAQRFQVVSYLPRARDGAVSTTKIVYEGIATNIALNTPRLPHFTIPEATYVVEERSALVAPLAEFAYTTTNGCIMNRKQLLKNEHFLTEVSESR